MSDLKFIECPRDAMQGLHDFIPTEIKAFISTDGKTYKEVGKIMEDQLLKLKLHYLICALKKLHVKILNLTR